jgi:hypothetical protein
MASGPRLRRPRLGSAEPTTPKAREAATDRPADGPVGDRLPDKIRRPVQRPSGQIALPEARQLPLQVTTLATPCHRWSRDEVPQTSVYGRRPRAARHLPSQAPSREHRYTASCKTPAMPACLCYRPLLFPALCPWDWTGGWRHTDTYGPTGPVSTVTADPSAAASSSASAASRRKARLGTGLHGRRLTPATHPKNRSQVAQPRDVPINDRSENALRRPAGKGPRELQPGKHMRTRAMARVLMSRKRDERPEGRRSLLDLGRLQCRPIKVAHEPTVR